MDSFLSHVFSTEPPLSPLLLFISRTTEPAFTAVLETVPVSPGRASLHPVRFGNSESAVYVVSLTQPHLLLSPALLSRLWRLSVTTHSKFKPASSFAPASSFTPGASAPRDSLCRSPLCVPFQPLLSHLPAPGTLCPSKREAQPGCPIRWPKQWLGISHFLVTEPVGRWVPRTGQPYFCSFSITPLFLPPFTWLNWVNSSRKILWRHFFFLSVGARV